MLDLVIRNGIVVKPAAVETADIGIQDGKIVLLKTGIKESARETINATGLHIFSGVIDAHVHFNEPGRADWEGIATGTQSLAAGGTTLYFDMPLNAHPPTVDAESFDLKLRAAEKSSLVDFAFWGGLVPGNVDKLEALAGRGVIGFKAFMSNSGIEDFSSVDDATLRDGMKVAARLQKIVAVHAESDALTQKLSAEKRAAGKTSIRDYLDSRPVEAELDAIRRAVELAGTTGCALHVVHVSSGAGVALIAKARLQGVDVSCETCPHYLTLTEDDVIALGAVAKCAPPLRPPAAQAELWQRLAADEINTIGSDHSPAPPSMKTDADFFKVWGGIAGAQDTLPLLLTEGHVKRNLPLTQITQWLAFNVAQRFGLPAAKGSIRVDGDADLAIVDLQKEFTVEREGLFYRHKQSPYVGRKLRGAVKQTMVRGQTVFKDGKIVAEPLGKLVKPTIL